jgi:hypothetical protein
MRGNVMGQQIGRLLRLVRSTVLTGIAHVRRGWWRDAPFLPLPDPAHLAWRRVTAYGEDHPVTRDDLTSYLLWADRHRGAGS